MKVVDTPTLIRLADHARKLGLSRAMPKSLEKCLDPNGKHILSQPMIHGDVHCIRCLCVLLKTRNSDKEYEAPPMDFSIDDYNRLPKHDPKPSQE